MKTCSDTRCLRHAGIDFVVGDVERRSVAYRLRGDAPGLKGQRKLRPNTGLTRFVGPFGGDDLDLISNDAREKATVRSKQAEGTCEDRVEHRLHIRLRLADHAQDVAGGGLRVESPGQVLIARLQLRK